MDMRTYQREYARRKRHRQWLAKARSSRTCPTKIGRHGVCGAVLETVTDGTGRLVITCPRCERKRRGICRDCPAPVAGTVGKAIRCAACKRREQLDALERHQRAHRKERNRRAREYAQRPEVRARKAEYKRLYRKAHPEKVRQYKRREALRQSEARRAYHARYNAWRAEAKRAAMREQYRAEHPAPEPVCRVCARAIPWEARGQSGRAGRPPVRCVLCMARENPAEVRAAVRRWMARDEAPAVVTPKPAVRPRRPKHQMPTRYGADGARLCVTANCTHPVQRREKKCGPCKAAERAYARQVLGRAA